MNMNTQYSKAEFERRLDLVVDDYPLVAGYAACASQNAQDALVAREGYSREEAFNDQSDLFIQYFGASMAGFAEEL